MKRMPKLLALVLSFIMVFVSIPFMAFATTSDFGFTNSNLTIASEKNSTLAPGVTQDAYTLYNNKSEQVKMWVTTADMSVDSVNLYASYKDMDPTNYGMSKLTEQVASFNEKAAAGDEYYQGTVVAGINASYYNMITGKPTGTFVMNGVDVTTESEGNAYGYFAVMKDGSVKIGTKNEYSKDKGNIQEAIGIYTMLIEDGEICSGLNTTQYYPRQTIGITADGNVILMTADGNQAPKSVGLTVLEQAQVMKDLGCVWAGHLDGGGSCTYASKPEGSNDFVITNSPSDGSERSVSNGFIIASTVVADGILSSASLTAEEEYVTPNSSVNISATGVDKSGGPADIPENATWQLADSSYGTVEDGVFVSNGKVGDAVVQLAVDGVVKGETTIHVVIPEKVAFNSTNMTVPYGKSVTMGITATYDSKDVAIKPADFNFSLSVPTVGTIDGFKFTASELDADAAGESDIVATLVYDETITASAKITLGKGSEVVYNFEDGTDQGVVFSEPPGTKYNYVWPESEQWVADSSTGKVHSGNHALAAQVNYGNSLESGYMKTSVYATEAKVFKNATGVGAWIYIPDECVGLWARWTLQSVTFDESGNAVYGGAVNSNTMDTGAGGTGVVYTFDEPGWHYLYADTSAYSAVGWRANAAMMQFYISDRDGSAYGYKAAEQSNIPGKYRFYLDDITVDYSTAVDDREAPVFSNVTYATEGMPDAAALSGQTINTDTVTFAASVAEYTGKTNYTGLDVSSIKAYIDGVKVDHQYANGKVSITDAKLTNGKHTIKFSACDEMGNYACIYQYITVEADSTASTVKLVPQDASLDRIKLGSIYNMDLVATAIEDVESVDVEIDLDNNSTWQLDHMEVAEGFDATYTVEESENIATITITRTGDNDATGEAALATLPVRVWELKTGYVYPNGTKAGQTAYTYAQYKSSLKEFWRMSVIATVDKGVLTRVDDSVSTFTGERVFCDTEMWANYANMTATTEGQEYYNAWDGGHIHAAEAIADKAATCVKDGYTGRTFCEGCNSVVEWGTTAKATGHTYELIDSVLKCACGDLFNGIHTDGKTYVDGVVIKDGWNGESYYLDGVKCEGLQEIDGFYYFFDENGVCENKARLDGFFFDEAVDAYRYFVAGKMTTGEASIYPEVYFFDEDGIAVSGEVDILGYKCQFDEKGAFISCEDKTVVDAGFSGTNIEYVLLSNGTLKVDGNGVMKDYTNNGIYPAWVIQNDATAITSLELGNGITKIGKFGFYKNGYLRSIKFEENSSLKTIGWGAFGHCWRLAEVTIPASVETLEEYAFYECGALKSFNVEAGSKLKTIKEYAFQHDIGLESAFIPDTVTTLGAGVFIKANSDAVLNVVENSVAHYYAIENGLKYELRDGVVYPAYSGEAGENVNWEFYPDGTLKIVGSGDMTNYASHTAQPWASLRHKIKNVVIGKDVTTIGNYAFAYAQNIETVVFEEGSKLKSVGVLSFMDNRNVKEIILPETVTAIGAYAFGDCKALEKVYIPQGMSSIYHNAFNNAANVVLYVSDGTYAEEFAIENGIKYVARDFNYVAIASGTCGDNASWSLFENGELHITGSGAMKNFTSHAEQPWANYRHQIKKVVIGKDITRVGNYAFAYSQNITEIVFEEGSKLDGIGVLSFMNVPKVKEIVLPETVTSISAYGFGDCFALGSMYIPQGMSNIYSNAFTNSNNVVLNVAEGTYAEEFAIAKNIEYVTRDFNYVAIASGTCGNDVTWEFFENGELRINGSGAMQNYTSHSQQPWANFRHTIKKVVIGEDITSVGNYAFAYCQNLTTIEFAENSKLNSIGVLSFMNVPKVKEVVLPETVTSISAYGFGDCFALESVYIPQGMTNMYHTAFTNSAKVVLNVAEGTYAEEYAIAQGIEYTVRDFVYTPVAEGTCGTDATWAFYENGELQINGSGAMKNYTSHSQQPWANYRHLIKKVVIGNEITAVGNYAFAYCQNLAEIEFAEGSALKSIGVLSFMNVPKVKEVVLPETVTSISAYGFADCYALESVYVPAGMTNIYKNAFNNSTKVVLQVEKDTYAEKFAIAQGINYIVR